MTEHNKGSENMKSLISRDVQTRIARKLLLNEPELIEQSLRRNLVLEEPMDSCFEAMAWLDVVSDHSKGFNRVNTLQYLRPSADGSMVHGVFKLNGNWYKSSFRTGRLYFQFWGTDVGCLANVPEEDIGDLLNRFEATTYTHLKAEFSSVYSNVYHNNAFFSWKGSTCCGCICHRTINTGLVDSAFCIKMRNEDFLEIIRPYVLNLTNANNRIG
jgi:hypothetical protein